MRNKMKWNNKFRVLFVNQFLEFKNKFMKTIHFKSYKMVMKL